MLKFFCINNICYEKMEPLSYRKTILDLEKNKKSAVPVTLNEIPDTYEYDPSLMLSFNKYALYNPMRKLFNTFLHFLTLYSEEGDICICHGTDTGIYLDAIFHSFPKIKFIIIGNEKLWNNFNNVTVVDIINNERDMKKILSKYVNKKVLYFYGDSNPVTRKTTRDAFSKQELEFQKKIVEYLEPKKYSIRFNPPATENGKRIFSFDYLDGEIFLQSFNKLSSSETRLIGDTLNTKTWDLDSYFNRIFYLTVFIREWQFYIIDSIQTKGSDNCFDCAFEDKLYTDYIKKYSGFSSTQEMREWISEFDGSLSLYTEKGYFMKNDKKIYWEDFLSQKGIRDFITKVEQRKDKHGSLPRTDTDDIDEYLTPPSRTQITYNNIKRYANLNITPNIEKRLKRLIKDNDKIIQRSMTHKSINSDPKENYEESEIIGDALLRAIASEYVIKHYGSGANSLGTISNLIRYLTTGTQSTELFARMTQIDQIILARFEESDEKILEDVFESYLSALKIILDRYGDETQPQMGYVILRRMMYSLFDKIQLDRIDRHEISPPKTELKELFDERYANVSDPNHIYWDMGKVYTRLDSRGIKITKNKLDEWSRPQITIQLQFDKRLGLEVPSYTATGPPKYVEHNACKAFLEYLNNRGYVQEPRTKYIIKRKLDHV